MQQVTGFQLTWCLSHCIGTTHRTISASRGPCAATEFLVYTTCRLHHLCINSMWAF